MASDCEPISDPSNVDLKQVLWNISEVIYHWTFSVDLPVALILMTEQT